MRVTRTRSGSAGVPADAGGEKRRTQRATGVKLDPVARYSGWMSKVATHEDVTTVMAILGDIRDETRRIRWLLEDEDGEQEAEDDDLDG